MNFQIALIDSHERLDCGWTLVCQPAPFYATSSKVFSYVLNKKEGKRLTALFVLSFHRSRLLEIIAGFDFAAG